MTEKGHARGVEAGSKGSELFEDVAFDYISKKYSLDKKEILKLAQEAKEKIVLTQSTFPISILSTKISTKKVSSLEAIVKYLRENRKLNYRQIGILLNRNAKTLAVTYSVTKRKYPQIFSETILEKDSEKNQLPFSIFENGLSVLEAICHYMKSQDRSYSEIARMLSKDPRTIWTVCKRAEKKLKDKEQKNNNE